MQLQGLWGAQLRHSESRHGEIWRETFNRSDPDCAAKDLEESELASRKVLVRADFAEEWGFTAGKSRIGELRLRVPNHLTKLIHYDWLQSINFTQAIR
jgi:hypothetical protein